MTNIWDLFNEEEERLLEEGRAEIAAEIEAWKALPQAERDRISAERMARFNDVDITEDEEPDDEDEGDNDDD